MKQKSIFLYIVVLFLLVGCEYESSYSRSTTKRISTRTTTRTTVVIIRSSTTDVKITVKDNTTVENSIVMALDENSVRKKTVIVGRDGIAYFNLDDYINPNESKMFYFQVFDKVGNRYIPKSNKLPISVKKYHLYQATLIKRN